jgi:hypothetical protein
MRRGSNAKRLIRGSDHPKLFKTVKVRQSQQSVDLTLLVQQSILERRGVIIEVERADGDLMKLRLDLLPACV